MAVAVAVLATSTRSWAARTPTAVTVLAPLARVPSTQFTVWLTMVHPAGAEVGARPVGIVMARADPAALEGPLFSVVKVISPVPPAAISAGPPATTCRSAASVTTTVALAALSEGSGSSVSEKVFAVFTELRSLSVSPTHDAIAVPLIVTERLAALAVAPFHRQVTVVPLREHAPPDDGVVARLVMSKATGKRSAICTLVALAGPLLVVVSVYEIAPP